MPRRLFALFLALVAPAVALAQLPPDKALASLKVADGLQVELFAAEPMLLNPTSIDVDHLGRVWVCEGVNYRRLGFKRPILRDAGDRIVVLTDTNADGKADESSVFYQGKDLIAPLGIAVAKDAAGPGYKVFVCQSPDILLFEDKDGDAKADGPPKKFLTGFSGFDHDHGVHGILIGPDGKLYFTVGDSGVGRGNGPDGKPIPPLQSADGKGRKWVSNDTDCRAGTVWRCDFDGTNLELIAHNFRNNYEACVNSFGEVWLSDNDDDGNQQTRICFVMPGGNYGYYPRGPGQTHWHEEQPGIVHKVLRTGFGSPTGICFYEGTLLPKKYHGQLLHTDAGPRELRCFHLKPKGAGYEATQENLVTSTDNWFRLSDVCVAPDGSVIISDWYDPGVGGHGMGDWTRGRIYRVTPKGHKGYKVPEVKLDSREGLREALASPCLATRSIAHQRLKGMKGSRELFWTISAPFIDEVLELRRTKGVQPNEILLARIAWILSEFVDRTVPKSDRYYGGVWLPIRPDGPGLGLYYRIWTDLEKRGYVPDDPGAWLSIDQFLDSKPDDDLRLLVRDGVWAALREALCGAERDNPKLVGPRFYAFAKLYDGHDHFYRAALNIACGTDPKRRAAILADFDKHFPEWNDKVADLVWELRPASVLPRLGKLLDDPKLTPAQKGRIVDILAVNDDPAAGKSLIALLGREALPEMKTRALENLRLHLPTKWKSLAGSEELKKGIDALLKDPKSQVTGLQLVAAANYTAAIDQIGEIIGGSETPAARAEAVRTLGHLRHPKAAEALAAVLMFGKDPALSTEAIQALGQLAGGRSESPEAKSALTTLQSLVSSTGTHIDLKRSALSALAGSRAGTGWLLRLKEENKLPADLLADAGRLLRNSPFQGERNKALLLFPAPGKLDPKKLPPPAELAKRTGDAARGEAVFKASLKGEAQCQRCHMVRGVGGNIGPDLSMIGKKASKENLYDSLLLPSKAIADQYLQWKVDTLDGKTVTGLLVAESEAGLTLRDANGKDHSFAAKDLDGPKQKSLVSLMPDNLVAALTEDELIDLVEYMFTLKTASLTPESWHIVGHFPNDGNDSALDTDLGLESAKAIDLSAAVKGPNGPLKWTTVHVNAAGYVDLMAHYPGKSAHSASYLYRVIESPADQEGVLLFGNDDGAKVWVNGEKVFENREHLAASPGRHRIPVKLKKGPNAVLIKIVNGNDPHGLYFALTSEQELKAVK
jgi:putative membrane-bound dehydrogenase-like protein